MAYPQLIKKVRAAAPKPAHRPGMNGRTGTLKTLRASSNGTNTMPPVAEEPLEVATTDEENSSVGGYETEEETSSESDSSSSSSESSEDEDEQQDVDPQGQPQPKMRPFIASVFDGKLASVVICDECKHGAFRMRTSRENAANGFADPSQFPPPPRTLWTFRFR